MKDSYKHAEDQLLTGFREGREESFSKLFENLYPALCFYVLRFTNDLAAAEDIAEESFIKIWGRRETFHQLKVLKSYLYTTARHASLDWLKRRKRQDIAEKGMTALGPDHETCILEEMIRAEWLREVSAALDSLPPRCGRIIRMLFIDGKKARVVAEELQLSINTVKKQRANGLMFLRKLFPDILTLMLLLNL